MQPEMITFQLVLLQGGGGIYISKNTPILERYIPRVEQHIIWRALAFLSPASDVLVDYVQAFSY